MKYKSLLSILFLEINRKLNKFNISHDISKLKYYNTLNSEQQDLYIDNYMAFFYCLNYFRLGFKELLTISRDLEDIKLSFKAIGFKDTRNERFVFYDLNSDKIKFLTHRFITSLTALIKLIEDNKIIEPDFFRKNFNELNYIKNLRNQFIQHPKLNLAFHQMNSISIPNEIELLPFSMVSPGGGGLSLLTSHYLKKIKDKIFLKSSNKEKEALNKERFIQNAFCWKGKNLDNNLVNKIRAYGLPQFNQKLLVKEIEQLFDEVIFPYLSAEVEKARDKNIL